MTNPTPYYQDDFITIYHGDNADILPYLPVPNLLLTDPPYLMHMGGGGCLGDRPHYKKIKGFTNEGFDISLLETYPNWISFCSLQQLPELINLAAENDRWMLLTWNKPNPIPAINNVYLPDTEYVVHSFRSNRLFGGYADKARYYVCPSRQGLLHPNEKPVGLMQKLVRLGTQEGELVLDPFMGSGTTLLAAKYLKRKAIGIEVEEKYCEIAAKRLSRNHLDLGV